MSDDLVRRSDMLETYAELYDIFDDYKDIQKVFNKVFDKLNSIPTVEPKQGEWMGDKCSVCGNERAWYGLQPNFCPDCGARMKGTDDGEMA